MVGSSDGDTFRVAPYIEMAKCGHKRRSQSSHCAVMSCENYGHVPESLESQVERLTRYIMENVPGEPSHDAGAIDTAIQIMSRHYGPVR